MTTAPGPAGWFLAALVGVWLLPACSSAPGRDQARDDLVEQLVDQGLPSAIAACVVDRFFAAHSDDELEEFYDRDELTDDELTEFARLGRECGA